MTYLAKRFKENPLVVPQDISPSRKDFMVECVMNPGVFEFQGKIWLIMRVAERPTQKKSTVSLPVYDEANKIKVLDFDLDDPQLDVSDSRHVLYGGFNYLSTLSHLRLFCSDDGIEFYEPDTFPSIIEGSGSLESFGIEDCRVTQMKEDYILTFTSVSPKGVGVGLILTQDWLNLERKGLIFLPHNKDCAVFPELIENRFFCFNRPSGLSIGGNFIWISSSPDLIHWGNHHCLLETRRGMWDSARVGAGASPIRTSKGWLAIYHGANDDNFYCLGAVLLDLDDPTKIIARSEDPIMIPEAPYEKQGFFGDVVFTNGHIVRGDKIIMYYGASDTVICGASFSISEILNHLGV